MLRLPRRTLVSFTAVFFVLAVAVDCVLLTVGSSRAPSWSHWWCSASALHVSSQHPGQTAGGLFATLLNPVRTLLPHWPHILPILLALGTLIYLWRANTRYHAQI